MATALEAFCLTLSAEMRMCDVAERRKPRRSILLTNEAIPHMLSNIRIAS